MARIIYAVCGEGFGHASRAHLVGQRFLDAGHDVMFVSSHRGLLYLRQYYGQRVREIFGLSFDYSQGYVDKSATVWKNLRQLHAGRQINRKLFDEVFRPFKPDLIVTDFEPFTAWWAVRNHVPFISIDNEHLLVMARLEHGLRNIVPRFTSTLVTRLHYVGAKAYVITNFFEAPLKKRTAILAPPIVRPAVTSLTPSNAGHIVVYSTTGTHESHLCETLNRFPDQQFLVYGFNRHAEMGNCILKERSTQGFLEDLASARGVVASAGSSLLAECLYLRKRMLLLPLAGQYEQIVNACYTQKLGLGIASQQLDEAALARFLRQVDEPMPQDGRILWPDNERFFDILQGVLSRLDSPISIAPRP